jgi:hypothetical protein
MTEKYQTPDLELASSRQNIKVVTEKGKDIFVVILTGL